jgi:hypothetical protein
MMLWLLWARYLVLALLAGVVASFIWVERSRERQG